MKTLKGTRVKGLPPKVKITALENTSGSFPTNFRISSDNRTGKYSLFFNDTKTVVFTSGTLIAGTGVVSGSWPLLNNEQTSSLSYSGRSVDSVIDSYVTINSVGQNLTPFNELTTYASDGKSFLSASAPQNPFYATGSNITDVGEGFQQPLWVKTKIEFDLSVNIASTFGERSGSGDDYPMAYYDNSSKTYTGIGSRLRMDEINQSTTGSIDFFSNKAIGFCPSFSNIPAGIGTTSLSSVGMPIANFGFPWHNKFLVSPTSSFLCPLSGILPGPFLAEKMVLDFSGSYTNGQPASTLLVEISTFFILNQKRPNSVSKTFTQTKDSAPQPTDQVVAEHSSGSLDLVGVLQIASNFPGVAGAEQYSSRELNISSENWSGRYVVSGTIKSPSKNEGINIAKWPSSSNTTANCLMSNPDGGRSGLFEPCGRNFLQQVASSEPIAVGTVGSTPFNVIFAKSPWIINPYLLLPTDQLIFGWQVPSSNILGTWVPAGGTNSWTTLSFPISPSRLTIYGSMISNGKEFHDTLNQLTNTPAIHESIG